VRVKCPHCHKFHDVQVFKGSTSAKANAARRRNAKLAGRIPKISFERLEHIFLSLPDPYGCTGVQFMAAIEKATGSTYSRGHAFAVLKKLKANLPDRGVTTPAGKAYPSGVTTPSGERIWVMEGSKHTDKLPARDKDISGKATPSGDRPVAMEGSRALDRVPVKKADAPAKKKIAKKT